MIRRTLKPAISLFALLVRLVLTAAQAATRPAAQGAFKSDNVR